MLCFLGALFDVLVAARLVQTVLAEHSRSSTVAAGNDAVCSVPLGGLNAACFLYQVQGRTVTLRSERAMCVARLLVSKILAKL